MSRNVGVFIVCVIYFVNCLKWLCDVVCGWFFVCFGVFS